MHIKQARAPIGRGRWDHSFKQNNPPALAAEAKQRDNNILAFPHNPPASNRARISKDFGEVAPPFPAASASGVGRRGRAQLRCPLLPPRHGLGALAPAPGPQAAPQTRKTSGDRPARVDGPPPLPSSRTAPRQGPGLSSLAPHCGWKAAVRSPRPRGFGAWALLPRPKGS